MAEVIIALGSNLGNPHAQLSKAGKFLISISDTPPVFSPIYKSEPIGPSENEFLNAVVMINTNKAPEELFNLLKEQEKIQGRPSRYPKWTARTLDLDIIAYGDLVVETDNLIIPHAEYTHRLFVLYPLRDIRPDWTDPSSQLPIGTMVENAPTMMITRTDFEW